MKDFIVAAGLATGFIALFTWPRLLQARFVADKTGYTPRVQFSARLTTTNILYVCDLYIASITLEVCQRYGSCLPTSEICAKSEPPLLHFTAVVFALVWLLIPLLFLTQAALMIDRFRAPRKGESRPISSKENNPFPKLWSKLNTLRNLTSILWKSAAVVIVCDLIGVIMRLFATTHNFVAFLPTHRLLFGLFLQLVFTAGLVWARRSELEPLVRIDAQKARRGPHRSVSTIRHIQHVQLIINIAYTFSATAITQSCCQFWTDYVAGLEIGWGVFFLEALAPYALLVAIAVVPAANIIWVVFWLEIN